MVLLLYVFLGIIFGAKYFTYFTNYSKYKDGFRFMEVGFSSYGAVIGSILMLLLFSKQFKKSIKDLLCSILPAIPLMYGIGKIGCFLAGCCYGIEYSGLFNVVYKYSVNAPNNVKLFPVQLVEAIVFLGIFLFINIKYKEKKDTKVIPLVFILCGIAKFSLDYLRISHVNKMISINQVFSLVFIVIGLIILIYNKKRAL